MLPKDKLRRIEVLHDGEWVEAHLGQIEPGEEFRMFEPDGTPVASAGLTSWVAFSNASIAVQEGDESVRIYNEWNIPALNRGTALFSFHPRPDAGQLQRLADEHEMHMFGYLEKAWADDMGTTAEEAQRARDSYDQALAAAADHASVLTAILTLKAQPPPTD